jgi:hypothetical protein
MGIDIAPDSIPNPQGTTPPIIIKYLHHNIIPGFMNPAIHLAGLSETNMFIKEVLKNLFTIENILLIMTGVTSTVLTPEVLFISEPRYMNPDFPWRFQLKDDNKQAMVFWFMEYNPSSEVSFSMN